MMTFKPRLSRGMTLIEAVIVVALFSLTMGMVTLLFSYSSRLTKRSEKRVSLQELQIKVSENLRRAMAGSARTGNTFFYWTGSSPEGDLVASFITAEDVDGNRAWSEFEQSATYQGYKIFYRDQTDQSLKYYYHPIAATTEVAVPLTEAEIRALLSSATVSGRVLSENMRKFVLFDPFDGSIINEETNPMGLRWRTVTENQCPVITEFTYKYPKI